MTLRQDTSIYATILDGDERLALPLQQGRQAYVQVARGSVIYVPAGVAHKFHHITEDLRVLVVFSPPER